MCRNAVQESFFGVLCKFKCLDAVVDEKNPLLKSVLVFLHPLGKKTNKPPLPRKYYRVLVLSENSSWYRVVYQGTQC